MIFKQMLNPPRASFSYLICDPVTRETLLIDPDQDHCDAYLAFLSHLDLSLSYILLTRPQAAVLGAIPRLKLKHEARVVGVDLNRSEDIDLKMQPGDVLYLGEERIELLPLPQSPDAVAYRWNDRLFMGMAKTGDLPDSLSGLPGETLIYPGVLLNDCWVSCVARERESRTSCQYPELAAYKEPCCAELRPDSASQEASACRLSHMANM